MKLGLWIWKLWNDFTLPRKQITYGCLVGILKNMKVKHINDSNAPSYCNIPKKPLIEKINPNYNTSLLLRRLSPAKEVVYWGTRRPTGEWKIETWRPNSGRRSWGGLQVWGSFVEEIWVLGWNSRNSKGEIFIGCSQIFSDCSCPNNFLAMAVVICSCWM